MPAVGETVIPAKAIAKVVERYRKGEKVVALAKELKLSRATVYAWIADDNKAQLEIVKRKGLTPANAAKAEKIDLALENESLKEENARLWAKVRELMLKTGEI